MAHPVCWPKKCKFYPIGDTPAVCMTRDLAPESQADILLLGCSGPMNTLYTIFCEHQQIRRKLDFTCCDVEPAVLARNVLLLSLIADQQRHATIWNIFFHIYLDKDSHSVLVDQCKKLVDLSKTLQQWQTSSYGSFIRVCTEYTLSELHRHWQLYSDMQHLPTERLKAIRDDFAKDFHSFTASAVVPNLVRSSGPLMEQALRIASAEFNKYRTSGITFSTPDQVAASTMLNSTFVYSLAGEGCNIHFSTNPLVPFHFAALFGNSKEPVNAPSIVSSANSQFSDWCTAFHKSISLPKSTSIVLRFFVGEATAVCRALQAFSTTGTLKLDIPVAQWKAQIIELIKDEYNTPGSAHANFNVIDSSTLVDCLGLLNVLISAIPPLSKSSPSGVLYTETLKTYERDAVQCLYGDITTLGLLLGICSVNYLSRFTTRSYTHEIFMEKIAIGQSPQFHQVSTWKPIIGGDFAAWGGRQHLIFDPHQLGNFLHGYVSLSGIHSALQRSSVQNLVGISLSLKKFSWMKMMFMLCQNNCPPSQSGFRFRNLLPQAFLAKSEMWKPLLLSWTRNDSFRSGATPEIKQTSPCVIRVMVAYHVQDVAYPWPVIGSQNKLRIARKSLYIEIVVPVFTPLKSDGMKVNLFPVIGSKTVFSPWNIHRINMSRLPVLHPKITPENISRWFNIHLNLSHTSSIREQDFGKEYKDSEDALDLVRNTLHTIFIRFSGIQREPGPPRQVFALRDVEENDCDTILFINSLRFDLASHTMVCDAYVLPLTPVHLQDIMGHFFSLLEKGNILNLPLHKGEMEAWKQLLPAFVEQCRTWRHSNKCEYVSQGKVPLSTEMEEDPLCSCGRGKDSEDMHKVALWSKFAPYVTRIALSPLFAVRDSESISRELAAQGCFACGGKGSPNLMACSQCKKVRYCSQECQKKDWKAHKTQCKKP